MTDAMISYSRKDLDFVKQVHQALSDQKRDLWVDWEDIPKTAEWWDEIRDGIEKANNFVFVISPDSVDSEVCSWEVNHAVDLKKRLIPVLRREITDETLKAKMHSSLNAHNWIFAREQDDFAQVMKQIAEAMDTDLEHVHTHTRLLVKALEWDKSDRDGSLLLRGKELYAAKSWLQHIKPDTKPVPDNLHRQYISESQRVARVRVQRFVIATLFTVVVTLLAIFSIWQALRAEGARQIAVAAQRESQHLAMASSALVVFENEDLDLALSLALHAIRGVTSPETERALAAIAYAPGTRYYLETGWELRTAALSPDGAMVAATGNDGVIHIYDLEGGEEIRQLKGHTRAVSVLAYNRYGNILFSAGNDGVLLVWDTATGEIRQTLQGHQTYITAAALTQDGQYALSADGAGHLLLWTLATGESRALTGHNNAIYAVAFSADGKTAASGDSGRVIQLWDVATAQMTRSKDLRDIDVEQSIDCLALSPDGQRIFFCNTYRDQTQFVVHEWFLEDDSIYRTGTLTTAHSEQITTIAISFDGEKIVTGAYDNHNVIWSTEDLTPVDALHGHGDAIVSVGFSVDSKHILTASEEGILRVWDTEHGAQISRYRENESSVWDITFTPDGKFAIANNSLDLIELSTNEIIRSFKTDLTVLCVDFSADGKWLAGGLINGDIVIWDAATGEEIQRLQGHTANVWIALFTSDDRYIFSGADDNTVRQWDTQTWQEVALYPHESKVWALAISADDSMFASGTESSGIFLWKPGDTTAALHFDNALEADTTHAESQIFDVAFSPDGKRLVSGESDNHARIWDVATGKLINQLNGHQGKVAGVTYSVDGSLIITGAYDNQVLMWDAAAGDLIRSFIGHNTAVADVTISPDGKTVISGSLTGSLRLWYVHTLEELIAWTNDNRFVRDLTCDEQLDYEVAATCDD